MYPDYRKALIKLAPRLGALLALFIVGYFVISFVSSGTLTVTTGTSSATITIAAVPPLQRGVEQGEASVAAPTTTNTGTGSLTVRVHSGTYIVTVRNGYSQSEQTVNVGWLSHKTVNLNPVGLTTPEPVLYESVQDIVADNSHMIYLNNTFNGIETLNGQNQTTPLSGNQNFSSVAWADPSYGVAQDHTGALYIVDGGSIHPLQSPISGENASGVAYAVAPDRTIYIGINSNLFRGTEKDGFKPIYTSFTSSDSLVAANGKVMVISPNNGRSSAGGSATIIRTDGTQITKNFGYPLGSWTPWSRNGQYIVISVGSEPELFDSSLKLVGSVPQSVSISGGSWLDDNTLYYYAGSQLWSYDVSRNETNLIATLPGSKLVQGVSVSADGSYVYLTASNSNDVYPRVAFRVGLKGQQVSSDLSTLEDVLPISGSTFTIGLRNFAGQPTIAVTTFPGTDPTNVLQSAQADISGMINLNDMNYDVESGD